MRSKPQAGDETRLYNARQCVYFERSMKKTMIPVDTPYLRRHVDEAIRFGALEAGERILEVGCGMGRYTLLLAGRGLSMTGLDLSPLLLDRLRDFNAAKHNIALCCADVEAPPAELLGKFDAVVGFFTLHHLADVEKGMHGVRSLLKPGGRVVFLEPNPFNPLYYIQITLTPGMSWSAERGMLRMRPDGIARAMAATGLGDFGFRRFGFLPPFLANMRWGGRAEAALERLPCWRAYLPFQLFRGRVQ